MLDSLWFHLIVIPGVFFLGRLSSSVVITGFRLSKKDVQKNIRKARSISHMK